MAVSMTREKKAILTYVPDAPNDLPFFLEKKAYQGATGRVYPLPYTDRLSNEPRMVDYDSVTLSNEYVTVHLLPELGGKIHGAHDNRTGYEFIYENPVIKPAMVGLAGPWVSGGVEFNWPQHHRPTTFMPCEATPRRNPDGSCTCWMGEAEPFHRMRGMVGVTLYPDSSLVEAKAVVYNRTDAPLPFMWWNNLAVRVHGQYKAVFPPDVEWGNDHDRRAVISFPVMKGVYHTARPFDYGKGIDVTWYANVKLPTSVMVSRGQSDMDFLAGYDFAAQEGTVTVSDHHCAPGKKMWTWGDGDFGHAWCRNLTDNDDRYIELMTGAYTDNQPDFTYIMPGETRIFTQVWYPVKGIGEVKNATRDAAVSLTREGGSVRVGAVATRLFRGARVRLFAGERLLLDRVCDLSPDLFLLESVPCPDDTPDTALRLTVQDASGRTLAEYRPPVLGERKPPKARPIPPEPRDVATVEELYLHGAHLEQYKHHTYDPEDYYREALRRSPEDLRCNHAMGRLMMEKGEYAQARTYLTRAVDRLKMRNDNPADTQPLYDLARLERLEGHLDKAYELFWDASWQYAWRSASLYELACIDCVRGNRAEAERKLRECLEGNARHAAARCLLGYLTGDASQAEQVLAFAPQDAYARFVLCLLRGDAVGDFILSRPEDVTDVALDMKHAGLIAEAAQVLRMCAKPSQMLLFHLASLTGESASYMPLERCFPNRLEDLPALEDGSWQSLYLRGCLYYDRGNAVRAVEAWEKCLALKPDFAFVRRNLAQAYFDHMGRPAEARAQMEAALGLAPDNARILYELLQLYKNTKVSVSERLSLLERHEEAARRRDDCFLEEIILYTQDGQYERARELLLSKRFNIYEGGEGKLTRHHGWLYTLMGREAQQAGRPEEALDCYRQALVYPANYGEGRHYSAQEANIYYYTGLLLREMGDASGAREAFEKAAHQSDQVTEISYFAALAWRELGEADKAEQLLRGMLAAAQDRLAHAHLYGYFGVGMAAPLPFELDVKRMNTIDALLLEALAFRGLSLDDESRRSLSALESLDPYNSKLAFLRHLGQL